MLNRITNAQKAGLALLAAGLVTGLWATGVLAPFERPLGDVLLRLLPEIDPATAPVAVLAIDDAALAAHGPLPWPRQRLAALVDAAFARGARGVALDLILAEPRGAGEDAALSRALERGPTALAAALRPDGSWALPRGEFGGAARAAHAEAQVDGDGVVREILASKQRRGLALPALSLLAARWLRPELTLRAGGTVRPDFRLSPNRVPRFGAADVLAPSSGSADAFEGRVVFLGVTAAGAGDQFVSPVGARAPAAGVLLHASTAEALLRGGTLRRLGVAPLFTLCLGLALLAQALRDWTGRVLLVPMAVVCAAVVLAVLATAGLTGWQVPVVAPVAAFAVSSLLREGTESRLAQRQTGSLLRNLLEETEGMGDPPPPAEPRGALGRLAVARQLQSRLIRDRNLRRTLLDALQDGVVRWDREGRPLVVNAAAARLWGRPPRLAEVAGGDTGEPRQATRRHRGRLLRITVRPLDDGHLGVVRDVTAEEELESRRREMQRLVSHELKTPLAAISNFAEMLERYDLSREELRRLGDLIGGESQRLLEMVRTFLDLERLGSVERPDRGKAGLDLGTLAEERCRVLAAAGADHGLSVERRGPAPVVGDRELLARVLDNLIGNAFHHTPAGTAVRVEVGNAAGAVTLRVEDDGPGIDPRALPHLFERFYRAPGTGAPGSGLGLALVREITEWHGGAVDVESVVDRGTVFTVRLPAAAEREAA